MPCLDLSLRARLDVSGMVGFVRLLVRRVPDFLRGVVTALANPRPIVVDRLVRRRGRARPRWSSGAGHSRSVYTIVKGWPPCTT